MLEFAVLGLLSEGPLHGYELRKRMTERLGGARRVSFGSLYPTLRKLQSAGHITVSDTEAATRLTGRRTVVYEITAEGKERFAEMVAEAGPAAWEDEAFGVHVAFFSQADPNTRLRVLEGRRGRLEERREGLRASLSRTAERVDRYTLDLQQHAYDSVEREVRWLTELIDRERTESTAPATPHAPASSTAPSQQPQHH
ncbi:MAG TPA: PadR family transcriptional regulator [Mycobacteriales bacterium]|nr:PadR family transcriptional regulator [Mycobacteriales bacterium]